MSRARPAVILSVAVASLAASAIDPSRLTYADGDSRAPHFEDEGDEAREGMNASAFWLRQRAYPRASLPPRALAKARTAMDALPPFRGGPGPWLRSPLPPEPAWTPIGPAPLVTSGGFADNANFSPTAGRASAIAIDPSDSSVVYAGFGLGGVWKSVNAGKTWTPMADDAPSLAISAIAIDPSDPQRVYVGTGSGDLYSGYYGAGLFVSSDGGTSWSVLGSDLFAGTSIARVVIDPHDASIYVATDFGSAGIGDYCTSTFAEAPGQGLYRSIDGGNHFDLLRAGATLDLEVDATVTPRTLLISIWGGGVLRSTDGGVTWHSPEGLASDVDRIELAMAPSDPAIVYAGTDGGSGGVIFRSIDHGESFAKIDSSPPYCNSQCFYDNVVAVKPDDPATLYLGGQLCPVWKSHDALAMVPTFSAISMPNQDCGMDASNWPSGFVHPDVHAIAFDPNNPDVVYVGGDGGLAKTTDGGASFTRINDGIGTVQLYAVCADPVSKFIAYGGAQDNGVFHRTQASSKWHALTSGDGMGCAVDSTHAGNVLLSVQYAYTLATESAFKSDADIVFGTEQPCDGLAGCGDRSSFSPPMIADPVREGTFYIGTYRLWRSTKKGAKGTFEPVSEDLTLGTAVVPCVSPSFGNGDDYLSAIAVAPSKATTLYTGSAGGRISMSFDDGATWAVAGVGLPNRYASGIAVDPRDDHHVFVSFSGFSANTPDAPGHVFESLDGGGSWTLRDVPVDAPVNVLYAHPIATGLLYAGTDVGVLVTSDGGLSFRPLGTGLPKSAVYSLSYRPSTQSLVAGTFGRSAWEIHFNGAVAVTPVSVSLKSVVSGAPQSIALEAFDTDDRGSSIPFQTSVDAPWLSIVKGQGVAAGASASPISLVANPSGLLAGSYDATVTVTPAVGNASVVPVHLEIEAPPPHLPDPPSTEPPLAIGGGCQCEARGLGADGSALGIAFASMVVACVCWRRRRRV